MPGRILALHLFTFLSLSLSLFSPLPVYPSLYFLYSSSLYGPLLSSPIYLFLSRPVSMLADVGGTIVLFGYSFLASRKRFLEHPPGCPNLKNLSLYSCILTYANKVKGLPCRLPRARLTLKAVPCFSSGSGPSAPSGIDF